MRCKYPQQCRTKGVTSWIIPWGKRTQTKTVSHSPTVWKKAPQFPPSSWWMNINSLNLPGEKNFGHEQCRIGGSTSMPLGKPRVLLYITPHRPTQQHRKSFTWTIHNNGYKRGHKQQRHTLLELHRHCGIYLPDDNNFLQQSEWAFSAAKCKGNMLWIPHLKGTTASLHRVTWKCRLHTDMTHEKLLPQKQ